MTISNSFLFCGLVLIHASVANYMEYAVCANEQLLRWYDEDTGLFLYDDGAVFWWQAACMFTTFTDLAEVNEEARAEYSWIWENTYVNAPLNNPTPGRMRRGVQGLAQSKDVSDKRLVTKKQAEGFLNYNYDDEAWWAIAWIAVWDITDNALFLEVSKVIWEDMNAGWNAHPCGGVPWDKGQYTGPLAIENEQFIQISAALANRVGNDDKQKYLARALEGWQWFKDVGLINSDNLINDGVDTETCENRGDTVYSYNQGVIIGALVELYRATQDKSYLDSASAIADAVTTAGSQMLDENGILVDECDREQTCTGDGLQFKGIFTRNLRFLQEVRPSSLYLSFLQRNAQSIKDDNSDNTEGSCKHGVYWAGPYTTADASTQSSALDCFNAAEVVTEAGD